MTAEERSALDWLDREGACARWQPFTPDSDVHRATIKRMLAEPRLPKERQGLVAVMLSAWRQADGYGEVGRMEEALRALYAHLAKPKTKFGVSAGMGWVHFETLDEAMAAAKTEVAGGNEVQILKVSP